MKLLDFVKKQVVAFEHFSYKLNTAYFSVSITQSVNLPMLRVFRINSPVLILPCSSTNDTDWY